MEQDVTEEKNVPADAPLNPGEYEVVSIAPPVAPPVPRGLTPRVLVVSDLPGCTSGLGGQAQLVVEAALAAGFDVACIAFNAGERSDILPPRQGRTPGGVRMYICPPLPGAAQFNWIMLAEQPSLVVCLADVWQFTFLAQVVPESYWSRLIMGYYADCEHFPKNDLSVLAGVGAVVAMSKFAEGVCAPVREVGGRLEMIPNAVKPELLLPDSPGVIEEIRTRTGTVGKFVALHVGRNQLRKNQPHLIEGWAKFVRELSPKDRSRVRLYLHTDEQSAPLMAHAEPQLAAYHVLQVGYDLPALIAKFYADVSDTIRFSDRGVRNADLRHIYRFSDVCVNVAQGEGFGLINVEAPACGRAIIAADNTTTRELVGGEDARMLTFGSTYEGSLSADGPNAPYGWRVPCDAYMIQPDILEKRWFPNTDAMSDAFGDAWNEWQNGRLNSPTAEARRRAWVLARYGWEPVRDLWVALLRDVHAKNGAAK